MGFFLSAIEEQAQDAVSRSNRLLDLKEKFQREVHAIGATVPILKLIELLERLFDRPAFTISELANELELTHRGAALIVEKLGGAES